MVWLLPACKPKPTLIFVFCFVTRFTILSCVISIIVPIAKSEKCVRGFGTLLTGKSVYCKR